MLCKIFFCRKFANDCCLGKYKSPEHFKKSQKKLQQLLQIKLQQCKSSFQQVKIHFTNFKPSILIIHVKFCLQLTTLTEAEHVDMLVQLCGEQERMLRFCLNEIEVGWRKALTWLEEKTTSKFRYLFSIKQSLFVQDKLIHWTKVITIMLFSDFLHKSKSIHLINVRYIHCWLWLKVTLEAVETFLTKLTPAMSC